MLAVARRSAADHCLAADIEALPCRDERIHLVVQPDRAVVR
ncbi:MAG: hypothetical protein V5B30_19315 [Candidatus Accumulibacter delftensis]